MTALSDKDKERVSSAIGQAEKNTSGEIVVIVARQSDDYRFIALLWAALIALLLPLLLIYLPQLTGWRLAFAGPEILYLIQLIWFVVLGLLFQLRPLRFSLVPRSIRKRRVRRAAMEQFLTRDMHTTRHRTGVLVYVSMGERQVEIIADSVIAAKVGDDVWKQAVDELTGGIDAGRPVDGFIACIDRCGAVLATHFPPGQINPDEHPNHLIELN